MNFNHYTKPPLCPTCHHRLTYYADFDLFSCEACEEVWVIDHVTKKWRKWERCYIESDLCVRDWQTAEFVVNVGWGAVYFLLLDYEE